MTVAVTLVDDLVAMAHATRLDALPAAVVHEGRRALVDTVGCALAGMSEPEAKGLAEEMVAASTAPTSTVLGGAEPADAMWAAMANATAAVWHDFDGGNRFLGGHPAVHAIPAALAAGEREGTSGARLLEAVIAGYEVGARVGLGTHLRPGMHPHGTWPNVGAAAAVALVVGMGPAQTREAVNVSTSLTLATTFQAAYEGATVRNLYAGFGAAMGVLSADLVSLGFTGERDGIHTVFDGIAGVGFDDARALEGIGERWQILRGYVKPYACARYLHPALDALRALDAEERVRPESVDSLRVETFDIAATMTEPGPANPLAARFSLPHALAAYLVLGESGIDAFGPAALASPDIRSLAARTTVAEDPEMTRESPGRRAARVTVRLRGGGERSAAVSQASGEPDHRPMTDADLAGKFTALARRSIGAAAAAALLERLWAIEEQPALGPVTELARGS